MYQKSRQRWIKEGDSNSKYFHALIRWKRRKNAIVGLNFDDVWHEEPAAIKLKVTEFFKSKFRKVDLVAPRLDGIGFNQLSQTDNIFLTTPFDLEEIKEAVWECDGDRSSGPDRYNFRFIKGFWHILHLDLKMVLDEFFLRGAWPKGSIASFIALIPKTDTPMGLNEFRPIALVGCIY